jgi:hypothetical protein
MARLGRAKHLTRPQAVASQEFTRAHGATSFGLDRDDPQGAASARRHVQAVRLGAENLPRPRGLDESALRAGPATGELCPKNDVSGAV